MTADRLVDYHQRFLKSSLRSLPHYKSNRTHNTSAACPVIEEVAVPLDDKAVAFGVG